MAPWGYGTFKEGTKTSLAHRMAWEARKGPIPPNMCVCHKCDNPPCMNINHLFLGTHQDNMHDANEKGRLVGNGPKIQAHCWRGHPYGIKSLRKSGHRACPECADMARKARHRRTERWY
jgi:hypothetical protein